MLMRCFNRFQNLKFVVVVVPVLVSCGHSIAVTSTPSPANVYFVDANGARTSLAGQTPLLLKSPKDGGSRYVLEVEKTGFVPRVLVIEQPHPFGSNTRVSVALTEQNKDWFSSALTGAFSTDASALVNEFVELKTRIMERDSAKVKKLEAQMKARFEGFAVFNALMGEFYLGQKNAAVATKYLQKAVELNPQDVGAKQLLLRVSPKSK